MILTVTLNPAIDKTCKVSSLIPGQVNRTGNVVEYPGGKGINVARFVRLYNKAVTAVGFLGGYNGEFVRKAIADCGATDVFTFIDGNTRVNTNIIGDDGYITEILDPGPDISDAKQREFLLSYEALLPDAEVVVLSGSLPKGVPDDFYVNLIKLAKEQGKKVILDTSSYALKKGAEALPYMIKPNVREMEYLTGKKLDNPAKIVESARDLCYKGIEIVVVSMGKRGFVHVEKNKAYWAVVPVQEAINIVGCGDSMVAAYAYGISENMDMKEIIANAGGLSAANTLTRESGFLNIEKAHELSKEVELRLWE